MLGETTDKDFIKMAYKSARHEECSKYNRDSINFFRGMILFTIVLMMDQLRKEPKCTKLVPEGCEGFSECKTYLEAENHPLYCFMDKVAEHYNEVQKKAAKYFKERHYGVITKNPIRYESRYFHRRQY